MREILSEVETLQLEPEEAGFSEEVTVGREHSLEETAFAKAMSLERGWDAQGPGHSQRLVWLELSEQAEGNMPDSPITPFLLSPLGTLTSTLRGIFPP